MGKRAAKSNRRTLLNFVEPLESRVHLSATTPGAVVDVSWNGVTEKAIANQYVAETSNASAFAHLAAAKGFTNLQSLGNGFYTFGSALPAAQVAYIAKTHTAAITVVEPDSVGSIASTFPTDPMAPAQWYLNNTGQVEPYDYNLDGIVTPNLPNYPSPPYANEDLVGTVGQDDNLSKAWDITTGSPNVVVAVLDSGIDLTHPDLTANIWSNPFYAADGSNSTAVSPEGYVNDVHGWNFVANTNDVSDDNGHGTNVSGIIGAVGNNSLGVSGVDWNVKILPVKVAAADGSYVLSDLIAGVNYVISLKDQGINVVVMNESLGGPSFDLLESNAVAAAGRVGILAVAAAGNSSHNNDTTFTAPARYSIAGSNVITVAAIDNQGHLANFSNFGGQSVELAAPGVDILSTAPTYEVTLDVEPPQPANSPQFGLDYGYLSGTSQATPQVTGIIALEAAANPNATAAQLKKALLDGVTFDPFLASVNGLQPKVSTSGVANAFNAVSNILNQYVSTNTTRLGNWAGFYGSQGAYVVGDSTAFPSFVTATFDGASPVIVKNSIRSATALQKASNFADRIAAYDASATTESVNFTFTDGQPHRVSMYIANYDHQRRNEQIQILDPATGAVLDTQTITNLKKTGEYLTWDLRGQVEIKLTNLGGPNVVFSGIFFDAPPTNAGALQGTDTTTTGAAWRNQYGSQGTTIAGDSTAGQLPAYVTSLTTTGTATKVLSSSTNDVHSLQKVADINHNIKAYWNSTSSFDINIAFNDTQLHKTTLYVADYENKKRSERIEAINATTGDLLAWQDVSSFKKGEYVTFDVSGNVDFRIVRTGAADAVVSGVFFDAPSGEKLSFVGVDTKTAGNWKASGFGPTVSYIVGDNFPGTLGLPVNSVITSVEGATGRYVSDPTNDPRALLNNISGANGSRVAAYIYTTTSMTVQYTPGDLRVHRLELYFADYEHAHRAESITFYDASTNTVLARQGITSFAKGKYFIYDLQGPVFITITADSYPNAVLSGLFAD